MIEIRANGQVLRNFAKTNVSLNIDSLASTFSFESYLDQENEKSKELFKPFSYIPCTVWAVDDALGINEKLITGIIINPGLSVQKQIKLSSLSGYSKTGVLDDCQIPPNLHPLQTDGLGLDSIAKKYADEFDIALKVYDNAKDDAAKPFSQTKAEPTQTIKDYLSELAATRNITVAHDNLGRLLLYKITNQSPATVKVTENDKSIKISVSPNGQGVHSEITVIRQASVNDSNAGQSTVKSPFIPKGIKRPKVAILSSGENADTAIMAEALACREAKNFPITIEKQGWDIQGKIIRAGFYLEVEAPSIFIKTTKMIVQNITFAQDPKEGKTMTIIAVLPCVYTGKLPSQSPFKL